MHFSIKTVLIATAWIASSCAIVVYEFAGHYFAHDVMSYGRELLVYTVGMYAIFNPKMNTRAFWIGFALAHFSLSNFPPSRFELDSGLSEALAVLFMDTSYLVVGLGAHWGYLQGRQLSVEPKP